MPASLQIKNIQKHFGARTIFDDASVMLSVDTKVGFIGRNGAGKSTLCRLITGAEALDAGQILKSPDLRLSYLEQHDPFEPTETVQDFLTRYTDQPAWRCGEVAARFQLKQAILETPVGNLSGGYQTRVKLTAMLLSDPNFLILDEPSNYLDLRTLVLLEQFLQDFKGGLLVVSHDRAFLKRTCTHTLEAEQGKLTLFPGPIEDYLTFKQEQVEQALSTNRNIENKRKQLQLFVDRFRAKNTKASQARAKMKQIERLQTIEVGPALATVHMEIPKVQRRHGVALRCEELSIGYPEKQVASHIRMEIEHGAHVAVLGDNGQGKTTFLRTLIGELEPKAGSVQWGFGCEVAYYAQHVIEALNPQQDVLTHLEKHAAVGVTRQDVLGMAGAFLFQGDDVNKQVSVLSGGECARLCLAGLLLMQKPILLLDEPTNHLDFETVEALGAALKKFEGTIFIISHDRTFVNLVATQIVEVDNGRIVQYPGSYADYVYHLEKRVQEDQAGKSQADTEEKPKQKSDYVLRKQLQSEIRKQEGKVRRSEEKQEKLRKQVADIDATFAQNPTEWSRELTDQRTDLLRQLDTEEQLWLELTEQLELLKQKD